MRFKGRSELQQRGKGDIDHPFFDLGDLAVVDAAGIGHLPKAKPLLLPKSS